MNARILVRLAVCGCLLIAGHYFYVATPARATSIFLVTSLADSGAGSLREAIELANTSPGADTIQFAVDGVITLLSPLPAIAEVLTIDGAGGSIALTGDGIGVLIQVPAASALTVIHITFADLTDTIAIQNSGWLALHDDCIFRDNLYPSSFGVALQNSGKAEIVHCQFIHNEAEFGSAMDNKGEMFVQESLFLNNRADLEGGAISNAGKLEAQDVIFENNYAREEGGALINYGEVRLKRATFNNNEVINGGGAIFNFANLTIQDSSLNGNRAKWGGGIYNYQGSSYLELEKTVLSTNNAYGHTGGAILNEGTLSLIAGALEDNTAADWGGGLFNSGKAQLDDVKISGNQASNREGGGIFSSAGELTLNQVEISSNQAFENGGGLANYGSAVVSQSIIQGNSIGFDGNGGGGVANFGHMELRDHNRIVNNFTYWYGGGVYNEGELILSDSEIANNRVIYQGGGVFNQGTMDVHGTTFTGNEANEYGGGIYNQSKMIIQNSQIEESFAWSGSGVVNNGEFIAEQLTLSNNYADGEGGGLLNYGTASLTHAAFLDNQAYSIGGGGMSNYGQIELSKCTFHKNNTANFGGAMANEAEARIYNCIFQSNEALYEGGAVYNNGDFSAERSEFIGNHAPSEQGGAVDNYHIARIYACTFRDNSTHNGGGALHNIGQLTLQYSTLVNNRAKWGGGLSNTLPGSSHLYNNTFSANAAEHQGGAIYNSSQMIISHNTFANNAAYDDDPSGGSLFNTNFGFLEISASIVASSSHGGNCAGLKPSGAFNISDDTTCADFTVADARLMPLGDFGGPTQTHYLMPDSPAIDFLKPLGECSASDDQRFVERPQGVACDSGAVEVQQRRINLDIKPKFNINKINLGQTKVLPVAMLFTADFNAPAVVNIASLTFGHSGTEASVMQVGAARKYACTTRDVNGDRKPDLVCNFPAATAGFQCGDTLGYLKGRTLTGELFFGADSVVIFPCP